MQQREDVQTADELTEAFVEAMRVLDEPAPPPDAGPEATIDARIRANVLEIARKMLVLYHEAAWHDRGQPELLALDDSLEPAARVAAAWTGFVAKMRSEWEERLAADERFGREPEARKGRVQLSALRDAVDVWEGLSEKEGGGDGGR